MDHLATRVAEHLELDVARRLDVLLDQDARIAESGLRLAPRGGERIVEIGVLVDPPHAAAAAAGHRLDQHGIADLIGLALEEGVRLLVAMIAGHHRHARLLHQGLGAILEAHGADRRRRRADEGDGGAQRGFREVGILGQEPVSGMNALRAGAAGDLDQALDVEIAFARRRRPDRIGLVAGANMQRLGVGLGIDRDGAHPQPLRGAGDAYGDLAAIGDEDGGEHGPGYHPSDDDW